MKRLIVGVIAAITVGLVGAPVAGANHCGDPYPEVCHEFDWALPYLDAFERHGIGYLAERESIPLMNAVDTMCHGEKTDQWNYFNLTTDEFVKVVEAASDVCPEVLG